MPDPIASEGEMLHRFQTRFRLPAMRYKSRHHGRSSEPLMYAAPSADAATAPGYYGQAAAHWHLAYSLRCQLRACVRLVMESKGCLKGRADETASDGRLVRVQRAAPGILGLLRRRRRLRRQRHLLRRPRRIVVWGGDRGLATSMSTLSWIRICPCCRCWEMYIHQMAIMINAGRTKEVVKGWQAG